MDLKAIRFSCDSEHQENGAVNLTEIKEEGINIVVCAPFVTVIVDLHSPSISSGSKDSNKICAVNINVQRNLDIIGSFSMDDGYGTENVTFTMN